MSIHQGTYYTITFLLKNVDNTPINITGWTFKSQFRLFTAQNNPAALELTTAGGGLTVTNGPLGQLLMSITTAQTTALVVGDYVFDILRTDPSPNGPIWLFNGQVPVRRPVTRV